MECHKNKLRLLITTKHYNMLEYKMHKYEETVSETVNLRTCIMKTGMQIC